MNKGRDNIKGVEFQAWAAMSMFLQHVERKDFRYIGYEGDNLADFYLVFENGKRIICECKAYEINFTSLRTILGIFIKG